MAFLSNASILSLRHLFMSVGFLSLFVLVKSSVPPIVDFALYGVPVLWSELLSFLKPPFLYLIINFIILTVAASSRIHRKLDDETDFGSRSFSEITPPVSLCSDFTSEPSAVDSVEESQKISFGCKTVPVVVNPAGALGCETESRPQVADVDLNQDDEEESFVLSTCDYTRPQKINDLDVQSELYLASPEKPLVSTRFGHRKQVRCSREGGKALRRVVKPKKHDESLENTWKMMTGGHHVPLSRRLKKTNTWENHGQHVTARAPDDQRGSPRRPRKSETFRDVTNLSPSPSPSGRDEKIMKENSPSHDELNRRVEAFINKFNEQIRLQRRQEWSNHGGRI